MIAFRTGPGRNEFIFDPRLGPDPANRDLVAKSDVLDALAVDWAKNP